MPPTQPPAAPETDVRLTDREAHALADAARSTNLAVSNLQLDAIEAEVERIVAERVRVVEGERDAAMAETEMALRMHDVQWSRAESAEAAHRALQAAVEALADKWDRGGISHDLRALLAGGEER